MKATLQQAINDEKRAKALRAERKDFISDSEMDQFKFGRMSQEAQLAVAQTTVKQAQANLNTSEANLAYTKITAPVDGVIIDRKVDPGQTVASQFQTPELFIVAPDMRKEMRVFASVDEADIGLIRDAQEAGQPVHFTVDAYPDDLFEGKIFQIRRNSTTTQNVVTYPVLVSAPNPDLKLLPGMTASLSFQIGESGRRAADPQRGAAILPRARAGPPRGPQAPGRRRAARGRRRPRSRSPSRPRRRPRSAAGAAGGTSGSWTATSCRAVEVYTGLSDSKFTELVSGDIREGQKLVTGIRPKE